MQLKAHQKLREVERDNTGVEAAHKVEFVAERGAGRFLRWNKNRLRSKPYRAVRQAQSRLQTEQTRLTWQTALRDHPELQRKNALSKWYQKQKIKRRYAQAAREAQKTAQQTQNVLTTTGKIVRAVAQTVSAHRTVLGFIALLALVIMCKVQEQQGKRLETLESRDGEKWRQVMGYALTAVVGIVLGFLFRRIGL